MDGSELKGRRFEKNVSQRQLAELLGENQTLISRMEMGLIPIDHEMGDRVIKALARAEMMPKNKVVRRRKMKPRGLILSLGDTNPWSRV